MIGSVGRGDAARIGTTGAPSGHSHPQVGRNWLINGNFAVNQRGLNSSGQVGGSPVANGGYGFDRWRRYYIGGSSGYALLAHADGSGIPFDIADGSAARFATTSQSAVNHYVTLEHWIESVRTLAGKTATLSFWARNLGFSASISVELRQSFGTGGSTAVLKFAGKQVIPAGSYFSRYSFPFDVPSIAGKTIGTDHHTDVMIWLSGGSDYNARTGSLGLQNTTFDLWGFQLEEGSVATPFQHRPYVEELRDAQRYYYSAHVCVPGGSDIATVSHPTSMRVAPVITGGGAGFTYNAQITCFSTNQTTMSYQDLIFDSEF